MKKILFFTFMFLMNLMFICDVSASKNELYCIYDVSGSNLIYNGENLQRDKVYIRIDSTLDKSSYYIEADITFKEGKEKIHLDSKNNTSQLILINGDYARLTTCPKIGIPGEANSNSRTLVLFPTTDSAKGQIVASAYYTQYNGNDYSNTCLAYDNPVDCKSPSGVHCTIGNCETIGRVACVWNETKYGNYCNVDKLLYVKCGDAKDIPYQVPQVVSFAVNLLKIATPLILIFVSILTLLKAISSGNEDEMKKAQKGLIRKIIAAVMVFFVISIVQFVIAKVADSEIKSDENGKAETTNLSDCLNCFLNNKCGDSVYYKTYIGSELIETFLSEK